MLRRKTGYVKRGKGKWKVFGDSLEIAAMMVACALSMRGNGYKMDGVLREIRLIQGIGADATENGGANE